ncbi:hypothetical protein [Dankookia sp. P2]|uniref:hypothetical protein n=1 Tax=Dankookia sp. P2 TaxID=3423955 RepID=UPI003D674EAA
MTWVKAHLRWRNQPPPPKVVLVKNSVGIARARAAAMAASAAGTALTPSSLPEFGGMPEDVPEPASEAVRSGWIYADDESSAGGRRLQGRTHGQAAGRAGRRPLARDRRRHGLCRRRSPGPCRTPVAAEALVHQALSASRINPRREFFRRPFAEIRRVVEGVLSAIGQGERP